MNCFFLSFLLLVYFIVLLYCIIKQFSPSRLPVCSNKVNVVSCQFAFHFVALMNIHKYTTSDKNCRESDVLELIARDIGISTECILMIHE